MANKQTYTSFYLNQDAYCGFDAQTLKQLLIQRLNQTDVFKDQNYEGSNISSLNDLIAYIFHVLLFYLNQTSSESMFTQATLYENMNRIIKLIDFNPIGYRTSSLVFDAIALATLQPGIYSIPRFSYLDINGISYCFTKDSSFTKTANNDEELSLFSKNNILNEGSIIEHPLQTALGDDFEVVTLVANNDNEDVKIDHFNFSVFVKNAISNNWYEYTETSNLFLENNTALKYEKRLNENGNYEFKFGNNIYGRKLNNGDLVAIYYLKSSGKSGEIDANTINNNMTLKLYNTTQFNEIKNSVFSNINFITTEDIIKIQFTNKNDSTLFTEPESVEDIRNNISKVFNSQVRLINNKDIKTFIERNFRNVISSCEVVNNKQFINGQMSYFQNNLGITKINKDPRILFNQVNFSNSCNFNNIYVYVSPSNGAINSNGEFIFVPEAQKQNIINTLSELTPTTSNIVIMDPVYMAFAIGMGFSTDDIINNSNKFSTQTINDIINETEIIVTRYKSSTYNTELIKDEIYNLIVSLFSNNYLGQTIYTTILTNSILNISGVKSVYTIRNNIKINGINFLYWNPVYDNIDIRSTSNDINLEHFQFPYLFDKASIKDRINVIVEE